MSTRDAREQAVITLYEADQRGRPPDVAGLSERAAALATGVWEQRAIIDESLGAVATGWRVERMPPVDRNVLRVAAFELRERPDTPTAVVIAEAVRLAKVYSTEQSGRFVNGVLARLARETRAPRASPADR